MHNSDLKVLLEKPLNAKNDSDDETVLSDESYYDPSTPEEKPVVYSGVIGFLQDAFKAGSIKGGIFALICSTLGKGMLMLPNAMSYSGLIWSTIQVLACAIISQFSLNTLTRSASGYKSFSYQRLAELSFGNWYKRLVNVTFFLTYWGSGLAVLVLISEFAGKIFGEGTFSNNHDTDRHIWTIIIATFFIYPLSLAKELKKLRAAYIFSFFFMVLMIFAVFYESFAFGDMKKNLASAKLFELSGASATFSTSIFAYQCHANCLDIYKELYNPTQRRIEKVIRRSLMLTVIGYVLIGFFGYVTFVNNLDILRGLEYSNGVILFAYGYTPTGEKQSPPLSIYIVTILEAFSLIIMLPMVIKPSKDSIQSMIFGKKASKITTAKHVFVCTLNVYSIVLMSLIIEDLASLVNLIGASLLSLICFVMPASFYLKLRKDDPMDANKFFAWVMGIVSGLFGIYATYDNIYSMMNKP